MKSFKAHLQSVRSFGEVIDHKQKPVFRSSAVFPVMVNSQLNTRILFMGYWLAKRNLVELGLLITLRDQVGNIIYRKDEVITSTKAFEVEVSALLEGITDEDFVGSVELEIFSSQNLVFPYPAFVVNYYNEHGSGVVHTTGRIYNDFEDLQSNEGIQVKECGFDLFPENNADPFFSFVNGHIGLDQNIIEFEIITESGKSYKEEINFGELRPLETMILRLNDFLPLQEVLNGEFATVKIKHNLTGFFPRFIAGNFEKDTSAVSITHTYYDNSDIVDDSAYWVNEHSDILYDSTVFVPLFIEDDWYTELKFYPIYSPSNFTMDFVYHDKEGNEMGRLDQAVEIKNEENNYYSIDFAQQVEDLNLDKSEVQGVHLIMNWPDKTKIPSRFKYGLNVGKKGKKYDLPTNICFGSQISNIKLLDKKGTFKWMPLVNHADSVAVIENASYVKGYDKPANLQLTFHKTSSDDQIHRQYSIKAYGQVRITLDDELKTFLEGNSGWISVKSDNPFVKAWYFDFNDSGVMGGDHSF